MDFVFYVHPSTDISVDTSTDRHSADISIEGCRSTYPPTDSSANCWSISRPTRDRQSTNVWVDMSTESCCLTVGRHVDRLATDIPPILHCYLCTGNCSLSRRNNLTLVSNFCEATQISPMYPILLRGFFAGVVNGTKPYPFFWFCTFGRISLECLARKRLNLRTWSESEAFRNFWGWPNWGMKRV